MYKLWQPQEHSVNQARDAFKTGKRRVLIQSATGSGKTVIACDIMKTVKDNGKRAIFLAPRRELVYQTVETLAEYGINAGVIMAGESYVSRPIMVASIDTIVSRFKNHDLPEADLLIVDEAHLVISPKRLALLERWADNILVLGLTATPATANGKGMGAFFDDLKLSWSIERLIQAGYLVAPRYFAPTKPDLSLLKVGSNGDYTKNSISSQMEQPKLIGDIVDNWFKLAEWRQTVVFCSSKAHSRSVCQEFLDRGVSAEHVDANTPTDERKEIIARCKSGETTVLCNVFVAGYGLNIPQWSCCIIARPTKSLTLYMQFVGRVLRIFEGKTDALIIDHSGCVEEHGFVESVTGWSLDPNSNVSEASEKAKKEAELPREIICADCLSIFVSSRTCPTCGHEMIPPTQDIPTHKADLEEKLQADGLLMKRWNRVTPWEDKAQFIRELMHHANKHGYKSGWVSHQYRARSGVFPNDARLKNLTPAQPTKLLSGWLHHQRIKKAHKNAK